MTTEKFLDLLQNGGEKELIFEYGPSQYVPHAYHITEIKNVHIDSVDCGANAHSYDETIVQLWWSGGETQERSMSAAKALKIFQIVDAKRRMKRETEIFFEYGYQDLATSVYRVQKVAEKDDQIVVQMEVPGTVCKPREAMVNLLPVSGERSCTPGGGCC